MNKNRLVSIGKLCLASTMLTNGFLCANPVMSIQAQETQAEGWTLSGASYDKTKDNSVYLKFKSGQKARIAFLSEDIFRIDVENENEKFSEYPEPLSSTHVTKITVKTEEEFKKEKALAPTVNDDKDTITIASGNIVLTIHKEKATMELKDANGKEMWKEAQPLSFDGTQTTQSLSTDDNEYFYGGGQQNGYFSHKNRKILIENKSTWVSGGVSSPSPFYMSSNGYGVLRNTFQPGSYDFGSVAKLEHDENRFDAYYFVGDSMKDVLQEYVELTGNPMFMPKYAFYEGNADCYNGDGEELLDQGIARAKAYNDNDMPAGWFLPNDGYGCGYGKSSDADENIENLSQFVTEAKKYGFATGLWTENDLDKLDKEVSNGGTQMIKTDVAWVGEGYSFGLNAVRQAYEGIENNSDNRGFVVSLDGWAGTQRYAGLWTGDQTGGNWEYIRFTIPTYIGSGLSGNPNVGSDLDGIYGSDKIISTRDFQWKSFTPIEINMDGWTSGGEKNPWTHGEPYASINRMYLKMKSALMPYIYTYAKEAHDTGTPMVRAMVLEYPNESYNYGNQTQYQYMWGENLLVAPLYQNTQADENGNDVRNNIYLPDENQVWIDYFTGKQYQGGQVLNNYDAPLWKLPLFVKNGAILPKTVEHNSQMQLNGDEDRIFEVYPAGDTSFTMYDDDGTSKDYKEGKGSQTVITSSAPKAGEEGDAVITVNKTTGDFDGMKKERGTQFIVNVSKKPTGLSASIGGETVRLTQANSKEEFEKGENVYYYEESPNLNHYASEGSDFANVEIKTTPKLHVKLQKSNIKTDEVQLKVSGFKNAQKTEINENDKELTKDDVPTLEATSTDSSITLNWKAKEDVKYGLIIDGNEKAIYRDVTPGYVHDSLDAGQEHTYQLVVYNSKSEVKGDVQRFSTSEDRHKNVIKDVAVTTNSEYGGHDGGYPASNAVDDDESSLWYTNWDDPETYSGTKWIQFDLKQAYQLDQLEYFNNGSAQIKNHEIQVSLDGEHWKTVSKEVWAREAETRKFVDLGGVSARYVKLLSYDKHHNSANEIRIYKKDGTSAFNPASTQYNAQIEASDETFLTNYMGVTADNEKLWAQASPGDFNYNNEIDAYDLAFMMSQKGLVNTGAKVAGSIDWSLDKNILKKGETATLTLNGKDLKDVYAFGLRIPLGKNSDKVDIKMEASETATDMMNLSKIPQNSNDFVVALSGVGATDGLNGDVSLGTVKITAIEDLTLSIEDVKSYLVSTGLDMRMAMGSSTNTLDVSRLEKAMDEIGKIDTSNYTNTSVASLNAAINTAKQVLDNSEASSEQVNEALNNMIQAVYSLQQKEGNLLGVLNALIQVINEKSPDAGYSTSDLDKLLAEVANAQTVASDESAEEETIKDAITKLYNKLIESKDQNGSKEVSQNIWKSYCEKVVEDLKDEYTAESMEAVKSNSSLESILGLAPINKYDSNKLTYLVNVANVLNLKKFGTQEANDALAVIQEAKSLIETGNATSDQIQEMESKLADALKAVLTPSSNPTDEIMKDELKKLIAEAQKIDVSNKTTSSKEAFNSALKYAVEISEKEDATQEEVDDAYQKLQAAIYGLQNAVVTDKKELKKLVEEAEKVNVSFYTKETADAFEVALKNAKDIYGDEKATQNQVDEAYKTLKSAMDGLKKNPEIKNPDEGTSNKPNNSGTPGNTTGSNTGNSGNAGNTQNNTNVPASKNPTSNKSTNTGVKLGTAGLFGTLSASLAGLFYVFKKKKDD